MDTPPPLTGVYPAHLIHLLPILPASHSLCKTHKYITYNWPDKSTKSYDMLDFKSYFKKGKGKAYFCNI